MDIPSSGKTVMHFLLEFTEEYPMKPPNIGFSVRFNYKSGVISQIHAGKLKDKHGVCLNLVGNYANFHTEWKTTKNEGWSPAYNVATLLVNVQSILLDTIAVANKEQYHNEYDFDDYQGRGKSQDFQNALLYKDCENYRAKNELPEEIMALLRDDAVVASRGNSALRSVEERQECWYTKACNTEDTLGYGVQLKVVGDAHKRYILYTDGDFISHTAYKDGLRLYPNKDTFQYFLPAWINPKHAEEKQEWVKLIHESLTTLGKAMNLTNIDDIVLKIYPELINSLVVSMMDATSDVSASLKMFRCILNLWRTFYFLSFDDQRVRNTALRIVRTFISREDSRRKQTTPNIGYVLAMATILHPDEDIDWSDFVSAYLDEFVLRCVFWWQKDRVEILPANTFKASEIGRKNSLFQLLFQHLVIGENIKEAVAELDSTSCILPGKLDELLREWKSTVNRLTKWSAFYHELVTVGMSVKKKDEICAQGQAFLDNLVKRANSLEGYHFVVRDGGKGRNNRRY